MVQGADAGQLEQTDLDDLFAMMDRIKRGERATGLHTFAESVPPATPRKQMPSRDDDDRRETYVTSPTTPRCAAVMDPLDYVAPQLSHVQKEQEARSLVSTHRVYMRPYAAVCTNVFLHVGDHSCTCS
jgi:hypothetical protein